MSTSEVLLQFSDLAGGIEDATRQATGQPMMAQSLLLGHLARFHPFGRRGWGRQGGESAPLF